MAKLTWKIWFVIILVILFALVIINPQAFTKGLLIKDVTLNTSIAMAGIQKGEILQEINGKTILKLTDYYDFVNSINLEPINIIVTTENGTFHYNSTTLDFLADGNRTTEVYGNAFNAGLEPGMILKSINNYSLDNYSFDSIKQNLEPKLKVELKTNKHSYIFLTSQDLGLTLAEIPKTRITTGLDLQGGARAIVRPVEPLSDQEFDSLLSTVRYRLNVYGITDVSIRKAKDISGSTYMVVELAGATPRQLQDLVAKQGKFEAKIGNQTVFVGGHNDITFVCRNDASCAYIRQCDAIQDGYACTFNFGVHLSADAAKRHANITSTLSENITQSGKYLNESLDLYLDDKLVDTLMISSDLKGEEATEISISGSGTGKTKEDAYNAALENMKKLQTVLITGSLPVKLEVVKLDVISPLLGKQFMRSIYIAAIGAFIAVFVVIYVRYRKFSFFIPVAMTLFAEVFLILGISALIKWNMDLASIAGIIAAIGTGVDDQVVMLDESRSRKQFSLKERIKGAFFMIMAAFATAFVSLIPLLWAGAGLLRGFAITTMIGISIGVFITRPAFGDVLKLIIKD